MRKWTWPLRFLLALMFIALGWHLAEITRQPPREPFIECAPEELMLILEKAFNISFPEEIEEIRTARRAGQLSTVSFIIRFSAEPNVVDAFLRSFPEKMVHVEEYDPQDSIRAADDSPAWFMEPIQQGKAYFTFSGMPYHSNYGIYVDTTNERKFIIYWRGSYRPSRLSK